MRPHMPNMLRECCPEFHRPGRVENGNEDRDVPRQSLSRKRRHPRPVEFHATQFPRFRRPPGFQDHRSGCPCNTLEETGNNPLRLFCLIPASFFWISLSPHSRQRIQQCIHFHSHRQPHTAHGFRLPAIRKSRLRVRKFQAFHNNVACDIHSPCDISLLAIYKRCAVFIEQYRRLIEENSLLFLCLRFPRLRPS